MIKPCHNKPEILATCLDESWTHHFQLRLAKIFRHVKIATSIPDKHQLVFINFVFEFKQYFFFINIKIKCCYVQVCIQDLQK